MAIHEKPLAKSLDQAPTQVMETVVVFCFLLNNNLVQITDFYSQMLMLFCQFFFLLFKKQIICILIKIICKRKNTHKIIIITGYSHQPLCTCYGFLYCYFCFLELCVSSNPVQMVWQEEEENRIRLCYRKSYSQ